MKIMKQSLRFNSNNVYAVYVSVNGDLEFRFASANYYVARDFYDRIHLDNSFLFEMPLELIPEHYRDILAA